MMCRAKLQKKHLIPSGSGWQGLVDAQHVKGMRPDPNVEEILSSVGRHVPRNAAAGNTAAVGKCDMHRNANVLLKEAQTHIFEPIQCNICRMHVINFH